ncbi:MAG: tetratricopeptide repeat protein [Acidobacteriota bacterium]
MRRGRVVLPAGLAAWTICAALTAAPAAIPVALPPQVNPSPPAMADDAFAEGLDRLRRQDSEGALRALREARRRHPDDPQVAFFLARALHIDTKLGEAEAAYRAALALQPGLGEAWLRLSEIYVEQGRLEDALEALEGMGWARGGGPQLDYQKGFVLSKLGRFRASEQFLRRSLAARPGSPDTLYVLGLNAQRQGDDQAAARAYAEVLAHDPDYSDAWFNLGNALARLGRDDEAQAALERFASVNEAREREKAIQARLRSLQKGVEMDLEAGRLDGAVASLDMADRTRPGLAWVSRLRGELLLAQGRRDDALVSLRRSAALNAPDAAEHLALSRAFHAAGDETAASREEQLARDLLSGGGGVR